MKEATLTLKYPQYDYKVKVVVTDDLIKSRNKRSKHLGGDYPDDDLPLGLFSYNHKSDFEPIAFIFLWPSATVSTISHEVFHMVKRIFDRVGSILDDSSEELFAYNLGYATEKIYDFVQEHRKSTFKK